MKHVQKEVKTLTRTLYRVAKQAHKKHKEKQRKQESKETKEAQNRKHLANVRVIQRNLVYITNLPLTLAKEEVLFLLFLSFQLVVVSFPFDSSVLS